MSKTKGRVTLPSESNFLEETKEMLDRWGADASGTATARSLMMRLSLWMQRYIQPIL
mgnify:CR=1 FL=1